MIVTIKEEAKLAPKNTTDTYSDNFIKEVLGKFGAKSNEYKAALEGDYALGSMIEEYLTLENISAEQYVMAYEAGDEEMWRYYQQCKNDEPYRRLYNMWLEHMHKDTELFDEAELYD